jgi:predicted SAM-dependent methyltransferase
LPRAQPTPTTTARVLRLNWGCGEHTAPGWINADIKKGPGVNLACDILDGLPLDSDSIDYVVSVHALPELAYRDIVPALAELRRVLKPGGVLRLVLPDLQKGIRAYVLEKDDYFLVDEREVSSRGGRFIAHMLWYGHTRTLFTFDFTKELLEKAGFADIVECYHRLTESPFPEIVELDNRENESMYIEAVKPARTDGKAKNRQRPRRRAAEPHDGSRSKPATVARGSKRGRRPPGSLSTPTWIEVLRVSRAKKDERLLGFHIGKPKGGDGPVPAPLTISGYVLGRDARAVSVEILSGDDVVARAPVEESRPSLAKKHKDVPGAGRAGFRVRVEPDGEGESELSVRAVLEDGSKVPLAAIRTRVTSAPGRPRSPAA